MGFLKQNSDLSEAMASTEKGDENQLQECIGMLVTIASSASSEIGAINLQAAHLTDLLAGLIQLAYSPSSRTEISSPSESLGFSSLSTPGSIVSAFDNVTATALPKTANTSQGDVPTAQGKRSKWAEHILFNRFLKEYLYFSTTHSK